MSVLFARLMLHDWLHHCAHPNGRPRRPPIVSGSSRPITIFLSRSLLLISTPCRASAASGQSARASPRQDCRAWRSCPRSVTSCWRRAAASNNRSAPPRLDDSSSCHSSTMTARRLLSRSRQSAFGQHQRQRFRRSDQTNRRQSSVLLRPLAARHVASAQAHRPRWLHRGGRNLQAQGGASAARALRGVTHSTVSGGASLSVPPARPSARRAECRAGLVQTPWGVNQSALALAKAAQASRWNGERRPAACCEECLCQPTPRARRSVANGVLWRAGDEDVCVCSRWAVARLKG